jgi:hypothetical protein
VRSSIRDRWSPTRSPRTRWTAIDGFVRFYEDLLLLLGDVPLAAVLERIDRSYPEPSDQRFLLGHLQNSLRHLHAERGEGDPRAVALEELIAALKARLGEAATDVDRS